ncbi:MAG: DUF2897 family protein [Alteromonadaceae bacterium]|nr:DUF2897 family protein [Alteromonadaceae bacterium]
MSMWAVIGIIAIVLSVIVSNIMLLKYSAKFKLPKTYTPPEVSRSAQDDEHDSPASSGVQDEQSGDSKQDKL